MTNYTAAERAGYEPPPCPDCGSHNVRVDWVDVSGVGPERLYIAGRHACLDCHNLRPPGQHGPTADYR